MKKLLKSLVPETHPIRLVFHRMKALVAALLYQFPARGMQVVGVTGTDGKTTTVAMTEHILRYAGKKTCAISTAFLSIDGNTEWNATQKTSPSPFMIQRFLRRAKNAGCTHAVIECSSHGLLQGRVQYLWPVAAGITNLSEEHLDYHGSMDEYLYAKSMLFRMLKEKGTKVLNAEDRTHAALERIPSHRTIHISAKRSQSMRTGEENFGLWLEEVHGTSQAVRATLRTTETSTAIELELKIPGDFNLENALVAIGLVKGVNIDYQTSVSALQSFQGVPGRIERIDEGQTFSVFVDFTVTPQSYEKTLTTLRETLEAGARLIVVTGSCGDRMREKRPIIGRICGTLADITIVTNEDPYTEDPEKIIDEVLQGIPLSLSRFHTSKDAQKALISSKTCIRESDRLTAIQTAFSLAKDQDIVLLAGKGSDVTMMTAKGQIPWNEREIARHELRVLGERRSTDRVQE